MLALDRESFKRWKPHLWAGVIADYDLVLEQDHDNYDEATLPPTSNSSSPIPPPPPPFVDDEVLRKLDNINSKIDQMKFEETTRLKDEVRKILT